MSLVQNNLLQLDAPVNLYIKGWKLRTPLGEEVQGVLIRDLLTHQGGTSVKGFDGYGVAEKSPSLLQILCGDGNSPRVEVLNDEKAFSYSGGGTTVLQYLIEEVTGGSYAEACLKMIHSFDPESSACFGVPKGEVLCGHGADGRPLKDCFRIYPELAAAGLWMTPRSLSVFMEAVLQVFSGRSGTSIHRSTLMKMCTSYGKGREGGNVGLGCFLSPCGRYFFHSGFNAGYRSLIVGSVDGDCGLIAMMNDEYSMADVAESYAETPFAEVLAGIVAK